MAKILIINQSTLVSSRLQIILEDMGHKTIATTITKIDALQWMKLASPDIICMDISQSKTKEGAKFAEYVRCNLKARIILIVDTVDKMSAKWAIKLRPDSYLLAPFSSEGVFTSLTIAMTPGLCPHVPQAVLSVLEEECPQVWNQISEKVLDKVYTYVTGCLDQEITLKKMSNIACMSESNFSRRFKVSTGITPYQYVLRARLDKAKDLLKDNNLSLVHIANTTGFSSQSHFSTVFKRATNVTPLKYRHL